jgi:NAD(P)-dependent dehydrogenase (short-subunit alcohol dehydrogenase family)
MRRLENKVCVVTGAAGGIGLAAAERLTQEGAMVEGIDLREHGVGRLTLERDLTDEDAVRDAFACIRAEYGRVDVLFNNAGLNDKGDGAVMQVSSETWDRVLSANLRTVYLCCKHGIPHLLDNDPAKGSVINTATFLTTMGAATAQMAYAAAKAGVVALSRDLGVHLARSGVRVNALALGPIATPALQDLFAADPKETKRRMTHIPMGRFGQAEEVAAAVAFLASDDAGYITGSLFPLDGAISIAYTVPES